MLTYFESGAIQFVQCDVRNWDDQVRAFEAAIQNSPHHGCDIVIANAGVVGADDLYVLDGNNCPFCGGNITADSQADPTQPPIKPDLRIVEINLIGLIYTVKLAMHYFRKQPVEAGRDRCLIIKGSIAAYADQPGSPQYNTSKWGARGLMRNLRRTAWKDAIRVNFVAPW